MKFRPRLTILLFGCLCALIARGQVIVTGYTNYTQTGSLPANDDHHSGMYSQQGQGEDLGFTLNFGGNSYSQVYISNNGYLTFGVGYSSWTPDALDANYQGPPIIAAFYSDVDTSDPQSGLVSWGTALFNGRDAFVAKWDGVGEYGVPTASFSSNTFEIVLVSRDDVGTGNFDVYFNYGSMNWDHSVSNNYGASIGFHSGTSGTPVYYQVPGSGTPGAFLDGGMNSLSHATNTGAAGLLTFAARDGGFETVAEITPIPEPSTIALLALGLAVIGLTVRRRRKS